VPQVKLSASEEELELRKEVAKKKNAQPAATKAGSKTRKNKTVPFGSYRKRLVAKQKLCQ
jgi:hypothetical protein